jgi:hypothetical protein
MNFEDKKIAAFARMSDLVVKKQIRDRKINSYDYLGGMINNMQYINTMLMKAAIKALKKIQNDSNVNKDYLTSEFHKIIYGSVEQYAHKA